MVSWNERRALGASIIATIGASVCCVGPLVLLALGFSGAWIGNLTVLEPYRPVFMGLAFLFLGLAYCRLYLADRACAPGSPCADPRTLKRRRRIFWIVALLQFGLLAEPWLAPLFY